MNWKIFKNINFSEVSKTIFNSLVNQISWFFLGIAIILTAGCCYLWYFYLYNPGWSEVKKQSYIQTKEAIIAFDREKFDKFIQETNERQTEFQKDLSMPLDVFRLKK